MHIFVLYLELLLQTPCLTFLDARNCDLNERVIPIIGRSLRMGCFLTTIHLENTLISGRAMVILGKFSMRFDNLKMELDFYYSGFDTLNDCA